MSGQFNHYDVFMKMLEVMAKDLDAKPRALSAHDRNAVTNIIEKLEGTLIVQTYEQEVTMSGDTYRDISNSVIAARGAIARGVINVREQRGSEPADALASLHKAIEDAEIPNSRRQEALELLAEISGKASEKGSSRTILKALGSNLKEILGSIGSISETVNKVWPSIETFWS